MYFSIKCKKKYLLDTNIHLDKDKSNSMSKPDTGRQKLIESEHEPINSSQKLNLLLQRSIRYSYRQRCCKFFPTVLCELIYPTSVIVLLLLSRYGINRLAEKQNNNGTLPGSFSKRPCSQAINIPPTSSNDVLTNCFKFPPSYDGAHWNSHASDDVSNQTNIVFQPNRTDVNELVERATIRLIEMMCDQTNIS